MRLYFAMLGVGKRSLWCAGFTDPPKPSGWYRKYIGNRTIEDTSANQKILTSLELIKLIGQYRFFYLYCSLCDLKWQREVPLIQLLLAFSLS